MNLPLKPVMMESTRRYIEAEIDWMLDLLDKEHQQARTHGARNNYQGVLRHRLELLRETLWSSQIIAETAKDGRAVSTEAPDDIPF